MVNFGAPYAMDGTMIPGAGLRRQLQRDAGEGSGVVRPGDLKITQLNVPSTGVKIAAGDDLIQCRAPGRDRETYGVPLFTEANYLGDGGDGIPGTTTVARRDMIIHEILDPSFPKHYTPQEQWPEGASTKLTVVPGVPVGARTVDDVPALASVTCYELAAINWPKSTATITNSMIEDLRRVHTPREKTIVHGINLDTKATIINTSVYPNGGQTWPAEAEADGELPVLIPWWANEMTILASWNQVVYPGKGNAWGDMWLQIGATADPTNIKTEATRWSAGDSTVADRGSISHSVTLPVPANLRGRTLKFYPRVNRLSGTEAQGIYVDTKSGYQFTVVFRQTTV